MTNLEKASFGSIASAITVLIASFLPWVSVPYLDMSQINVVVMTATFRPFSEDFLFTIVTPSAAVVILVLGFLVFRGRFGADAGVERTISSVNKLRMGYVELILAVAAVIPPAWLATRLGDEEYWDIYLGVPADTAQAGVGLWLAIVAGVGAAIAAAMTITAASKERREQARPERTERESPPAPTSATGTTAGTSWRRRVVLLIAGAAIGVAGLVLGGVALATSSSTRSDADAAAAKADRIDARIEELESEREGAQQQYDELAAATADVDDAFWDFESSVTDAIAAYAAQVSVFNEGIDLYNQGNVQQSRDVLNTRGTEAVESFRTAIEAQSATLSEFQAAVATLEEEVSNGG